MLGPAARPLLLVAWMERILPVHAAIALSLCLTLGIPSRPARADETTRVTVRADAEGATLRRVLSHGGKHHPRSTTQICTVPCSESVPSYAEYDVAGRDIEPSSIFRLPEGPSPELSVKRNVVPSSVGAVLLFLGACASMMGPVLALSADSGDTAQRDVGIAVLAVGAPLLATAIVLVVGPGNTRVYDKEGRRLAEGMVHLTPSGFTF
jgi:hypothetical protein